MSRQDKAHAKLAELRAAFQGHGTLLIVIQDNPDPDALAAATGLRRLANAAGLQCSLACGGTVGRSENRAIVRYLDLNLRPLQQLETARFDLVALVDTQPGHGNQSLPEAITPHIVIDHHPLHPESRSAGFTDIRSKYGATSTIIFEYLTAAGITPEPPLATALLYGIRSDTQDFGREAIRADIEADEALYPLANKRLLGTIQRGRVPTDYFRVLASSLGSARLCGKAIYCCIGPVENPDMVAEVADLLLRHEETEWSLAWGYVDGRVQLSVRTVRGDGRADDVMKKIVAGKGSGGGHNNMAGGQIPLEKDTTTYLKAIDKHIRSKFLQATRNSKATCRRLV